MKNIVIIGASGHGSMVLDCLIKEGKYTVVGFVDSFKRKNTSHDGYAILGTERDLPILKQKYNLYGAIVAIGNNWTRNAVADKVMNDAPELQFVSAIHPSALIGKNVQIGKGSVIMPGAVVNANSRVSSFCIVNTNSSLGHDGTMDGFSSISSGVCTGGNLVLGRFSAISLGANVIENIAIGQHSIIGAGSLVVKDVEGHSVYYGSPARFVRKRRMGDPYLRGDVVLSKAQVMPLKI